MMRTRPRYLLLESNTANARQRVKNLPCAVKALLTAGSVGATGSGQRRGWSLQCNALRTDDHGVAPERGTLLLKLSARIEESVRRIVVHLPQSFAYAHEWTRIARQLGAAPS